jgi:TPR repeat protein
MFLAITLLAALPMAARAADDEPQELFVINEERPVPAYTPDELPAKLALATEKSDPEAQYTIGAMLYYGKLIEQDKFKGEKYVKLAADAGYVPAMTQMAIINMDRESHTLALDWLFKAVKEGEKNPDPWACYLLANYYDEGKHIFKSYPKAKELYDTAAKGGILNASLKLGFYYQYGKGVEKDLKKAIAYYQYVGEYGHPEFQLKVAQLLQVLYGQMSQTTENQAEIFKWQLKAAELGDHTAIITVAQAYFEGMGVEKNYPEAIKWYSKAAEDGHVDSMVKLAQIYTNGVGTPIDYEKAAKWYMKAAENGSAEGAWNLGHLYANGLGVPQDDNESKKWFARSRTLGSTR